MCVCVSVHVCVSVIKGLPYEDTSCESRNAQQDLSLLSEAHTQTERNTENRKQVKEGERRAEEETDMTVSLRHKEKNGETNRDTCRHRKEKRALSSV